jgi:Anti-sigma regulatory factor (Ser/Thr protein kinase)
MADFMTGTAGRQYLELPAEPASVSCAREHVAVVLASLGLTSRELIDDAQLITSELVTNAITASIATGPAYGHDPVGGALNGPMGNAMTAAPARPAAGKRVRVGAYLSGTCLTLEFWDDGAGVPKQVTPGDDDVSGRGLLLVEALSRRWGYTRSALGGKVVWVELDVSSYLCDVTPC